jgi:hypothetical protein
MVIMALDLLARARRKNLKNLSEKTESVNAVSWMKETWTMIVTISLPPGGREIDLLTGPWKGVRQLSGAGALSTPCRKNYCTVK